MKLLEMYKKGKIENNRLIAIDVPKNITIKSLIFSILFTLIISIPLILIVASLLTVFSPVRGMFWVTMILIYIFLTIVYASSAAFNVVLLKNYVETGEILSIDTKAIFVHELFNLWILILAICIDIIICRMAM